MGALKRHLAIARQYWRIGWIRKSQFRWEFFNQVLMDCCFYGSYLFTFHIIFGFDEGSTLAGWSRGEMALLLGLVFVHDGFQMAWLGQGWFFGRDLRAGNLDPVRLRPGHPVILYFFQRFSPEGLVNLTLAFAIFFTAAANQGVLDLTSAPLMIPWAVLLAWWGQTMFNVFGSTFELYFLNSDLGRFFSHSMGVLAERPLDIYPSPLRRFLLFALPAGAMSYIPACMVLGRISIAEALAYTVFYLLLGGAIVRFWRWSFRRYESAMG